MALASKSLPSRGENIHPSPSAIAAAQPAALLHNPCWGATQAAALELCCLSAPTKAILVAGVSACCARCRYKVTFPLFRKVDVNGPRAHPIWKYLNILNSKDTDAKVADWNFNKYLVDRKGFPVKHFASAFDMVSLEADIEAELGKGSEGAAVHTASQ